MGGNGMLLLLASVLGFAALHFALRQRRLRRQLSQAAQQLAVILDGGSDEALLVPLCDDALTPLLGQIDRLLLEKKKLSVQQRRARLAQRRMLANMAHDLRTPLTVLLGQLEIARLRGEESETLRRVQAKAEEVLALSEAFFTLSKLEAGDTKLPCAAVDLSELCRAAALEYYDFLTQQRFPAAHAPPGKKAPLPRQTAPRSLPRPNGCRPWPGKPRRPESCPKRRLPCRKYPSGRSIHRTVQQE